MPRRSEKEQDENSTAPESKIATHTYDVGNTVHIRVVKYFFSIIAGYLFLRAMHSFSHWMFSWDGSDHSQKIKDDEVSLQKSVVKHGDVSFSVDKRAQVVELGETAQNTRRFEIDENPQSAVTPFKKLPLSLYRDDSKPMVSWLRHLLSLSTPVIITNAIAIDRGHSVVVDPSMIAATLDGVMDDSLTFNATIQQGGNFTNPDGSLISSFTMKQVRQKKILFVHDNSNGPPKYQLTVSHGEKTSEAKEADVYFGFTGQSCTDPILLSPLPGDQTHVKALVLADQTIMLQWYEDYRISAQLKIRGQRIASNGTALSPVWQLQSSLGETIIDPVLCELDHDTFAMIYRVGFVNTYQHLVFISRHAIVDGHQLGDRVQVTDSLGDLSKAYYNPKSIKLTGTNELVVTWIVQGSNYATLNARRLYADTLTPSSIEINRVSGFSQIADGILVSNGQNYVIGWGSPNQQMPASKLDFSVRSYAFNDSLITNTTIITPPEGGFSSSCTLINLANGHYLGVWRAQNDLKTSYFPSLHFRLLNENAQPIGAAVFVNNVLLDGTPASFNTYATGFLQLGGHVMVWDENYKLIHRRYAASGAIMSTPNLRDANLITPYLAGNLNSGDYDPVVVGLNSSSFWTMWSDTKFEVSQRNIYGAQCFTSLGFSRKAITINEGEYRQITNENILARNLDLNAAVTIIIDEVTHGQFELVSQPHVNLRQFSQEQIDTGQIYFRHDGGELASQIKIRLRSGDYLSSAENCVVTFSNNVNDPPIIVQNALAVDLTNLRQPIPITNAHILVDDDNLSWQIQLIVLNCQGGSFTRLGTVTQTFTQYEINQFYIKFIPDGTGVPRYTLRASDGQYVSPTSTVSVETGFSGQTCLPVFQVNQLTPSISMSSQVSTVLSDNRIVIVWLNFGATGTALAMYAAVINADGSMYKNQFRVNTSIAGNQNAIQIVVLPNDHFIIFWKQYDSVTGSNTLRGQRFDNDGQPLGLEFTFNFYPFTEISEIKLTVQVLSNGDFVIGQSISNACFRRFDSQFNPLGDAWRVNANNYFITGNLYSLRLPDDSIVAVWGARSDDYELRYYGGTYNTDIWQRRFFANGTFLDRSDTRVNEYIPGEQYLSSNENSLSVAFLGDRSYAIVYRDFSDNEVVRMRGTYVRRFSFDGADTALSFTTDYYLNDGQCYSPSISTSQTDELLHMVCMGYNQQVQKDIIFIRRFASNGAPVDLTSINLAMEGQLNTPTIVAYPRGGFFSSWLNYSYISPFYYSDIKATICKPFALLTQQFNITSVNQRLTLSPANIVAVDRRPFIELRVIVSDLFNCELGFANDTSSSLYAFPLSQISKIQMRVGNQVIAPSFTIRITDGTIATSPVNANVSFIINFPPAFVNNSIPLFENGTTILDSTMLAIVDKETSDPQQLLFAVTEATHVIARSVLTGNLITEWSQSDIARRRVAITHDGSEALPYLSVTLSDGTTITISTPLTFIYIPVNNPPRLASNIGPLRYTENDLPIVIDDTLTIEDRDSPFLQNATVRISVNFQAGEDVVTFTPLNGIGGHFDRDTGILTLTGAGTVADYQTVLRSVRYQNISEEPNTLARAISIVVSDGQANSNVVTTTLQVISVNDAPVLTAGGNTISYVENTAPMVVNERLVLNDVDSDFLQNATVRISGNFQSGEDVLTFTPLNGIDGYFDRDTGILTLTGIGSVADYQAVLRSVRYQNISDDPNTLTRVISMVVSDGQAMSNVVTTTLQVVAVNDAPVLTAGGNTISYVENAAPMVVNERLVLSDPDSHFLRNATVRISVNFQAGEDVLTFTPLNGIDGHFDRDTGILSLTGIGTAVDYQAVLRSVRYQDTSDDPSTLTRVISMVVSDGQAASNVITTTLQVVAVNDAPVLTAGGNTISYVENAAPMVVNERLVLSDVDSRFLQNATVRISVNFQAGEDVLTFTPLNGINGHFDRDTGILSLTGIGTAVDYQAVLRSVRYQDTSENPTTLTRTIGFIVSDGQTNSNVVTTTLNVVSVNDAPVMTGKTDTLNYVVSTGAALVQPLLRITDVDSDVMQSARVSITTGFVPNQDLLTVTAPPGISSTPPQLSGILTLTGRASVRTYQDILQTLNYDNSAATPDKVIEAVRTIEMFVTDEGGLESAVVARNIVIRKPSTLTPEASSPTLREQAQNFLNIYGPFASLLSPIAIYILRQLWINYKWTKHREYEIHDSVRRKLGFSVGTVDGATEYITTLFWLIGKLINEPEADLIVERRYNDTISKWVKELTPEQRNQYSLAIIFAINEVFHFKTLCCDTPPERQQVVNAERITKPTFSRAFPYLPSCFKHHQFDPTKFRDNEEEILAVAREKFREQNRLLRLDVPISQQHLDAAVELSVVPSRSDLSP